MWIPGLVPALNATCRAFGTAGDSVMTNTPVYPPFLTAPTWQGRELIAVPLAVDERHERYVFDRDAMEAAVTKQTRLFRLCNPHNPVGRVWRHDELRWLLDFCRRHELILVADEIHCDLILDTELRHHTLLGIDPWAHENSLTLMAPSKTFNVPGLVCAFVIAPNASLRSRFQRAARGLVSEVNCFGYDGCEAAYRFGEPWRQELLHVLRRNRALVESFVRLNFGCPESMLREALRRMALACRGISSG